MSIYFLLGIIQWTGMVIYYCMWYFGRSNGVYNAASVKYFELLEDEMFKKKKKYFFAHYYFEEFSYLGCNSRVQRI